MGLELEKLLIKKDFLILLIQEKYSNCKVKANRIAWYVITARSGALIKSFTSTLEGKFLISDFSKRATHVFD